MFTNTDTHECTHLVWIYVYLFFFFKCFPCLHHRQRNINNNINVTFNAFSWINGKLSFCGNNNDDGFVSSLLLRCATPSFVWNAVSDTPKDDLLGHFEECLEFIESSLADGKHVLVHWWVFIFHTIYIHTIYKRTYAKYDENRMAETSLFSYPCGIYECCGCRLGMERWIAVIRLNSNSRKKREKKIEWNCMG